ncbi:hypothetical protein NUW54_g6885 [Trametes sanguinea]|uniref:Uncharacterized protein n=1 Tax=Trametes sanguinea TaxID=158606 RepID=A0ACC1PSF7_9APHY|nr:hypothetical protein NUW54_g6885 [Trametes sanguinea]
MHSHSDRQEDDTGKVGVESSVRDVHALAATGSDGKPEDNTDITLNISQDGVLYAKSQVTDYTLRGDGLGVYTVLDFFADIYEEDHDDQATAAAFNYDKEESEDLYSQEGLRQLKLSQLNLRELTNRIMAVEAAKHTRIFAGDLTVLQQWLGHLQQDAARVNVGLTSGASPAQLNGSDAPPLSVQPFNNVAMQSSSDASVVSAQESSILGPKEALPPVDVGDLHKDQFCTFDIISWHLQQTLAGRSPLLLQMILYGEGGTGKSRVIQTVTEAFAKLNGAYLLVKAAYTGIAASLINGKTTHTIGHLLIWKDGKISDKA